MNTPICSFLEKYASDDNIRLHMPGHKGIGDEREKYDITEIDGADSLYEASGIIKQSEDNASQLFNSLTLYSTEGSSLAIRAMLQLALLTGKTRKATVLAGRNAHKVFISAAALLDFDIEWLGAGKSYLSCEVSPEEVAERIDSMNEKPLAVYLTSPDYLGNIADIKGIADVCHERDVLLLVDNAHGAYLAFTEPKLHPIALGADMCADSAHKTLPCLTGAAYLHIGDTVPESVVARAKTSLELFGSTSPSYLILASLDNANVYLANGYTEKLTLLTEKLQGLKTRLKMCGYEIIGNEPMKLTLGVKAYGYTGYEVADILTSHGIVPEFKDPDFVVLMPTPEMSDSQLERLECVLTGIQKKRPIPITPPKMMLPKRIISPRDAIFSQCEKVDVKEAVGRILAEVTVGCPPAVPIVVSGEQIDEGAVKAFQYYGITHCSVVK